MEIMVGGLHGKDGRLPVPSPRVSSGRLGLPMCSRKTRRLLDFGLMVAEPGDPGRLGAGS